MNSTRNRLITLVLAFSAVGCAGPNGALKSAALGAGVGAVAGQAIGGDTESTVLGTAIGAGAGYILGNEREKRELRESQRHPYRYRR